MPRPVHLTLLVSFREQKRGRPYVLGSPHDVVCGAGILEGSAPVSRVTDAGGFALLWWIQGVRSYTFRLTDGIGLLFPAVAEDPR